SSAPYSDVGRRKRPGECRILRKQRCLAKAVSLARIRWRSSRGFSAMTTSHQDVSKILHAIRENFAALGHSVHESGTETVIHLPHLVSLPSFSREEQKEQVQLLTEISIKSSGVKGATYTIRETNGREAGNKNWFQFYVEIHVPKGEARKS